MNLLHFLPRSLLRLAAVSLALLVTSGCMRPDFLRRHAAALSDTDDLEKHVALQVACKDGAAMRSTSFDLELEDLMADPTANEEFRPFEEAPFWMRVRQATPKAIALTVRVEDELEQEVEILFNESRVFRLQGEDRWVQLKFYEYRTPR
jgi:hypothetical protein